ncbi:MAG: ribose 5-phosphate isomerase B [Bradymonadia bacterium]
MSLRIAVASDHAGFGLKSRVCAYLKDRAGVTLVDLGPASAERCDYPDYAAACARHLQSGQADLGVLICGSGIGISIAANRFRGIRAALVQSPLMAQLAREHNDANILCLGSRLVGDLVAFESIEAFIETEFAGGRHAGRVAKIELEE